MPLGSAVAINFSAPLFATLASAIFLREAVGPCALDGAGRRSDRGRGDHQSRRRDLPGRLDLRHRQRRPVRLGDGRRAWHDRTESTETLIMYQMVLLTVPSSSTSVSASCGQRPSTAAHDAGDGRRQCLRPILVDAGAASGAGFGGDAVLLFFTDLGAGARLRRSGATCRRSGCSPARRSWSAPACFCSGGRRRGALPRLRIECSRTCRNACGVIEAGKQGSAQGADHGSDSPHRLRHARDP